MGHSLARIDEGRGEAQLPEWNAYARDAAPGRPFRYSRKLLSLIDACRLQTAHGYLDPRAKELAGGGKDEAVLHEPRAVRALKLAGDSGRDDLQPGTGPVQSIE